MTANTQAIITQLKQNPEFINELNEAIADAICVLVIDHQNGDFENKEIIDKLASLRLDLRKLVKD